ncbi:GH92 family glycosyl hydrolase [Seonamhaeicola sp.]|uniref:GH92 family glycosyl hydrolase n=1 Tax=Seonamhaeicola sp. TaxID=1912245 RepID=UPI002615D00B|nr:GH92 family glycosyl hydrolase [Seonamhaeicola sp.]
MNFRVITILLVVLIIWSCEKQEPKNIIDYVNPMIGTDGLGHTFPGATTPFGMVQLSPSEDIEEWDYCSGYHYKSTSLKGFAHTHFSGTGLTGLGDFLFIPTTGDLKLKPGTMENPDKGYRSRFSHENEKASVGYYQVLLDDYNVNVELTTTPRVGVHRYTFKEDGIHRILIDPTHNTRGQTKLTELKVLSNNSIQGMKHAFDASCGNRKVYFYAEFSKPFSKSDMAIDDIIIGKINESAFKNTKAVFEFEGTPNEQVEVYVAISFVSYDGAKANFEAEVRGKGFNEVHKEAIALWEDKIDRIEIEATPEQKTIFYTAMYHNFIAPNIISDVNGDYIVEGKRYHSPKQTQYSNFSTWDTFRATHPLWSIIDQETNKKMVNVLLSRFTDTKTGLALWEALGHDNYCMPGYPGISAMAEAALKHPEGLDVDLIYESIRETAFRDGGSSVNYGSDNGVRYYVNYGFVPAEVGCGVTKTTENNYYDFAIAQLAEKLGKKEDAQYFKKRSLGYRNLYNPTTKYLWPRQSSGRFIEMDTTHWDGLVHNYVSGNIWAYSAYTPHDMLGAINLFGDNDSYSKWLDDMINNPIEMQGEEHVDIAGFIGKYSHGDEPGHQIPYLYNFAGKPWKTQELVRRVMTEMYSHHLDGMVNNEDCGQMSAWYILSGMGFYPVAPADMNYYLGSPSFPKSVIKLENGKTFTVLANNVSEKNKYIQSVTLNGKSIDKIFIKHQDVSNGGELIFEMGPKPNKEWASTKEALPQYQKELLAYKTKPMACYTPFIKDEVFRFGKQLKIELISNNKNDQIYYTLDGNDPTQNSYLYTGPFSVNKSTQIKAVSFQEGFEPSPVFSKSIVKSIFEGLEKGYPKITFDNIPEKYGEKDGSQLIDLIEASTTFSDRKWTGVNNKDLIINLDLGKVCEFSSIKLNTLTSTKKWRFPPKSISVFIKDDLGSYKLIKKESYQKLKAGQKQIIHHSLKFKKVKAQHIKLEVENYGELPKWHEGAGKSPWIFVDELNVE